MKKGKVVSNNYLIVFAVVLSLIFSILTNKEYKQGVSKDTVERNYEKQYDAVYVVKTVEKEVVNVEGREVKEVELKASSVDKEVEQKDIKTEYEDIKKIYTNCQKCDEGYNLIKDETPLEQKIVTEKKEETKKNTSALKNLGNKNVEVKLVEPKVVKKKTKKVTTKSVTSKKVTKTMTTKSVITDKQKSTPAGGNDLMYLACIVYAEAGGESYNGKLAVANVVLNRKSSSKYPNSIYGVISQRGQFGPYRNGSFNKAISKYKSGFFTSGKSNAYTSSYKAAKAALNGNNNVGKRCNFNTCGPSSAMRIGHHKFW